MPWSSFLLRLPARALTSCLASHSTWCSCNTHGSMQHVLHTHKVLLLLQMSFAAAASSQAKQLLPLHSLCRQR